MQTEEKHAQTFGMMLLLFPFFHPGYVSVCVPWLDLVYNAGKVISALVTAALCLRAFLKDRRISASAVALIVMELWMLCDVLVHQGVQGRAMQGVASVLVVCALIEIETRERARQLVRAMRLLLELLIGIHFVTMLAFPGGLYETPLQGADNWFLGYRNSFIFYFAPLLSLELMERHASGCSLRFAAALAVCCICMVMGGSATGSLCMLVFAVLALSGGYRLKGLNSLTAAALSLAAFFAIVVLRVQSVFTPVFRLLGRELTFTGRLGIWDNTIEAIRQSPAVGYGMQTEAVRAEISRNAGGITAHNFLLEQTYCFGMIGLLLLIAFLGCCILALYRRRTSPYAGALCLGLICFFMVMLMEGEINNVPMYSFLFLCCRVGQIAGQMPEAADGRHERRNV